jgi:hypothetical protein
MGKTPGADVMMMKRRFMGCKNQKQSRITTLNQGRSKIKKSFQRFFTIDVSRPSRSSQYRSLQNTDLGILLRIHSFYMGSLKPLLKA